MTWIALQQVYNVWGTADRLQWVTFDTHYQYISFHLKTLSLQNPLVEIIFHWNFFEVEMSENRENMAVVVPLLQQSVVYIYVLCTL